MYNIIYHRFLELWLCEGRVWDEWNEFHISDHPEWLSSKDYLYWQVSFIRAYRSYFILLLLIFGVLSYFLGFVLLILLFGNFPAFVLLFGLFFYFSYFLFFFLLFGFNFHTPFNF